MSTLQYCLSYWLHWEKMQRMHRLNWHRDIVLYPAYDENNERYLLHFYYENEKSSPKPEYMYRLFNALKCDANYLHQDVLNVVDYCPERLKYEEMKHIGKYRLPDKYGKDMVDTVLNKK